MDEPLEILNNNGVEPIRLGWNVQEYMMAYSICHDRNTGEQVAFWQDDVITEYNQIADNCALEAKCQKNKEEYYKKACKLRDAAIKNNSLKIVENANIVIYKII